MGSVNISVKKIEYPKVLLSARGEFVHSFIEPVEWAICNREGSGTGGDGGKGIYVDDIHVPNNGCITITRAPKADGTLFTVKSGGITDTGDYEDKWVDVTGVGMLTSRIYSLPSVHVGDNAGAVGLSYTYKWPKLRDDALKQINIQIIWDSDDTEDITINPNDNPDRTISWGIDANAGKLWVEIKNKEHAYSGAGKYHVFVTIQVVLQSGETITMGGETWIELRAPYSSAGEDSEAPTPDDRDEIPPDVNPPTDIPDDDPDEVPVPPDTMPDVPDFSPPDFNVPEIEMPPYSLPEPTDPDNPFIYPPTDDPDWVNPYDTDGDGDSDWADSDGDGVPDFTHRLDIIHAATDKREYSWRVDGKAIISWKVVDENDAGVTDATCYIVRKGQGIAVHSKNITNVGDGWYKAEITLDASWDGMGELLIYAGKQDYAPAKASVTIDVSEWGKYFLDVNIELDAYAAVLNSSTPITITAHVSDGWGSPIPGATLSDNWGLTWTDNGDGTYTASLDVSTLPLGRYKIAVSASKTNMKSNTIQSVTETFTYEDSNVFKLSYPLATIVTVKVNGTETTNYTAANNTYGELEVTINDTLTSGDTVEITYTPFMPVVEFDIVQSLETITVIVKDEESINQYGASEVVTLYVPGLQSVEEAQQIGQEYLAMHSTPRMMYEVEMPYTNLTVGDTVYFDLPDERVLKKKVSFYEISFGRNRYHMKVGLDYEAEMLAQLIESLTRRV